MAGSKGGVKASKSSVSLLFEYLSALDRTRIYEIDADDRSITFLLKLVKVVRSTQPSGSEYRREEKGRMENSYRHRTKTVVSASCIVLLRHSATGSNYPYMGHAGLAGMGGLAGMVSAPLVS